MDVNSCDEMSVFECVALSLRASQSQRQVQKQGEDKGIDTKDRQLRLPFVSQFRRWRQMERVFWNLVLPMTENDDRELMTEIR